LTLAVIYKVAIVLTKSQLRGSQRSRLLTNLLGDPRIILVIDSFLLLALGIFEYTLLLTNAISGFREIIRSAEVEGLASVPTAIGFTVIVFGVLYEISQPVQFTNTDLVNWLPISPTEYVAGSIISASYLYSFTLSLFLGGLLGPALYFGLGVVWTAAALMAMVALLTGSCVVEILKALTNRISSSFYKRTGRSGIAFRLAFTIIILVFVQLIFSGQIALYLVQSIVQAVRAAWYAPVVWPSVAVLSIANGSILDFMIFSSLSTVFTLVLFGIAAGLRARNWIPVLVSIRLTKRTYHPSVSRIRIPGFGSVESAIFRKDLRSILRRREMSRFLAIPFILAISTIITLFSSRFESESVGLLSVILLYLLSVTIFVQMLGMTSLGSEGYAVWNIYAAPIQPRELLRSKLLYVTSLGVAFCMTMAVVFGILVSSAMNHLPILIILGIATVFEQGAIGIGIGARFPDFRETVRSRYVSFWGSILGILVGLIVSMVTISPILLSIFLYRRFLDRFTILAAALALLVTMLAWKVAERQVQTLLENICI
jgi:hypothetical protein